MRGLTSSNPLSDIVCLNKSIITTHLWDTSPVRTLQDQNRTQNLHLMDCRLEWSDRYPWNPAPCCYEEISRCCCCCQSLETVSIFLPTIFWSGWRWSLLFGCLHSYLSLLILQIINFCNIFRSKPYPELQYLTYLEMTILLSRFCFRKWEREYWGIIIAQGDILLDMNQLSHHIWGFSIVLR